MATYTKAEKAEALARLREWLKPGDTVYTICEHVSSSGMSRAIRFVIPYLSHDSECENSGHSKCQCTPKIRFIHPNHSIGVVLGLRFHTSRGVRSDALHVAGGGMDMGFHCVYNLGRYLFPDGFKVEGRGRNGDMSGHDNDGGYALRQEWL